jgi:midasin
MNPATDVGKRDLPPGLRNRLTEFYVDELEDREDLEALVRSYIPNVPNAKAVHANIVSFYLQAKAVRNFKEREEGEGRRRA